MNREILTHPLPQADMREELVATLHKLDGLGHRELHVRFGFGWAESFRAHWDEVVISSSQLLAEIAKLEGSKAGKLGSDDLFISVAPLGVEFQFCNDSDVHLRFETPNDFTESIFSHWQARGFRPAEWLKEDGKGPGKRLRGSAEPAKKTGA
jgi:hypothetical protein